ncbi:MAG: hypothetical protein M0Z84_06655 [Gammaproteobacteria bacterium]|nr:hypothetical protein [Gammaproteobacteria bacterium]
MGYSRAVTNGLLGRFHDTSLIHPQIKNRLVGTSAAKQQKALRYGLSSILKFVEGDRTGVIGGPDPRKSGCEIGEGHI